MDEPPRKRGGPLTELRENRRLRWLTVALAFGMPLYLISVGPAVWLAKKGFVPAGVVNSAYMPVFSASRRSGTIRYVVQAYLAVWGEIPPAPPKPAAAGNPPGP